MDRFDRNRRIPNWDQARLAGARVLVVDRGWSGTAAVWALASMGVGEILWLGAPQKDTERLANWFLADPCPFSGCRIYDYPFDIEYGSELTWVAGQDALGALAYCAKAPMHDAITRLAEERRVPLLLGTTAEGGWYGKATGAPQAPAPGEPVIGMLLGALLADSVREVLCPLRGRRPAEGPLSLQVPEPRRRGGVLLIGAGAVGTYAATLAVALGYDLTIVDFDTVDPTNLNRQGLFSAQDAAKGAKKAEAAARALRRFFPGRSVACMNCRVTDEFSRQLRDLSPAAIVSAVDNAEARLVIQDLARKAGVPVIQGGTDVFLADVYTQDRDGPTLDAQMLGALTAAKKRESTQQATRPPGGCTAMPSYVVPGMVAGALVAYRMVQALELHRGLPPLHWRSGFLPAEERRTEDVNISSKLAS